MNEGKIVDKTKLDYEIDWDFITLLAQRMQKGKEKYGPYSWHGPTDVEALKRAYFRHSLEVMKGNYLDDNQEYGHIGAAVANLMMIYYQLTHTIDSKELGFDFKSDVTELVRQYPNDLELGKKIRELVK